MLVNQQDRALLKSPLLVVSLLAGILYFLTQPWQPFPGSYVLKGLAVAPLAVLAFRSQLPGRQSLLLGAALLMGSLGDVSLDLSPAMFAAGLGAFLIGHFFYIALFLGNRPKPTKLRPTDGLIILGLGAFGLLMSLYLLPATGQLAPAVAMYMGALLGMVATSVTLQLPQRWVMYGALLFLVSDSVLAVSKFKSPVPGRDLIVWPTYYVGQMLIAMGYLRARGSGAQAAWLLR